MYLLSAIIILGAITVRRSLNCIEKHTANLEKYAFEVYQRTKKFETLIDNFKKTFNYSEPVESAGLT